MSSLRASAVTISTGRCFSVVVGLDRLEQLEAVHVGHVDVADDEVVLLRLQHLQRDGAVLGLVGVVAAHLLEQAAHDAAHGGEVVDDQELQVGGRAHGGVSRKDRCLYRPAGSGLETTPSGTASGDRAEEAVLGVAVHHDDADAPVGRARAGRHARTAPTMPGPARAARGRRAGRRPSSSRRARVGAVGRQLPVAVAALAARSTARRRCGPRA